MLDQWVPLWIVAIVAVPAAASAQSGTDTAVDSDPMWLPAGPSELVTLRTSDLAPHMSSVVMALARYQHRPIVLRNEEAEWEAIGAQFGVDVSLALGLFDQLQVSGVVPLTLVQSGVGTRPITTPGVPKSSIEVAIPRDMRFGLDWRPIARRDRRDSLGLLVSAGLTAPTGDAAVFASADTLVFVPSVVVDHGFGPVLVAVDLSARVRPETRALGEARYASSVVARTGASWAVEDHVALSLEVGASFELAPQAPQATEDQHGFDAGIGVRWQTGALDDFALRGAFALGMGGLGAPAFRVVVGIEQGAVP